VSSATGDMFTYALVEPLQTLSHHSGRGSVPSRDLAHAIAIMQPVRTRTLHRSEKSWRFTFYLVARYRVVPEPRRLCTLGVTYRRDHC